MCAKHLLVLSSWQFSALTRCCRNMNTPSRRICTTMLRRILVAGFLLVAVGGHASAQTAIPSEFLICSRIKKNSERLACFDKALDYLRTPAGVAAAPSAETSFGIKSGAAESRRSAVAEQESGPDGALESVTARIASLSADGQGMSLVTLDNGQTWRQLTGSTKLALKVGNEVTITRASFGSFLMSIPTGRPLRVRRVK